MTDDLEGPYSEIMLAIMKLKVMAANEADSDRKADLLAKILELEATGANYLAQMKKRREEEDHG